MFDSIKQLVEWKTFDKEVTFGPFYLQLNLNKYKDFLLIGGFFTKGMYFQYNNRIDDGAIQSAPFIEFGFQGDCDLKSGRVIKPYELFLLIWNRGRK